ncbi:single-stranded DNA-binding protein [Gemelliphila palaticanis]|uniref:Single-stranded DNA-binding protein n=1 Tax=Gemelliphila palaticanis TaxID=81950 RepID=A0ABX2SZ53_9BACL|nr:single-stranded DNA-binding protein [Gemella palaticanis]MBF0715712.1 single-stranded DNA-binding protein [Gemella palaticanis]NYS47642.1 single-stranded DNA-binding protein [Gemella palaticanis]
MLNQVTLIGRLVKKPELRESEGGLNYLKATIAVQSNYKNKDGDYEVEFLEFTAFGKVAQNTAKYCDKGSLINLLGSLSNNVYKDKNGVTHYQMSLIANKINFLSKGNKQEEIKEEDIFTLGQ